LFESLKKYFNVNKENKNYFYIFKRILCFEMFGNISIFRKAKKKKKEKEKKKKKKKKEKRREKQNFYQTKTLLSGPYIKRPQSSESDKCNWASIGPLQRDVCLSFSVCLSVFSLLNFHISLPIDPDHFRVKAYAERDGRRPWRGHDVQGLHGAPPKALARAHREGHVRYHVVSVSPLFFPLPLCFNLFSINKTLISFHNQLLGCIQIRYPRSACLMLFIII
jgi:hypothetical protein